MVEEKLKPTKVGRFTNKNCLIGDWANWVIHIMKFNLEHRSAYKYLVHRMETWLNRHPKWMYEDLRCIQYMTIQRYWGARRSIDRDFSQRLQRPGLPTGLRHDVRIAKRWVLHMLYSDILLPEGIGSAGRHVYTTPAGGITLKYQTTCPPGHWSFAGEVR